MCVYFHLKISETVDAVMTSVKDSGDVTDGHDTKEKDLSELPPSGTSLHRRRRGEPPASLSVKTPQTPSDPEGSSPCTAGPTPEDWYDGDIPDPETICDSMIQRLKDCNDAPSKRGRELAQHTKETFEALDQLEKILDLLDQFVTLKEYNARLLRKIKDVTHLKRLHGAFKKIESENEKLKSEKREIEEINEALDAMVECGYGQMLFDSMMSGRTMKRTGSKWKQHARFGGSLLRKQRSRSAGGDESDAAPGTPLRRRSEGVFLKESSVDKSKVSKWRRVKAAFRWEKAQWPPAMGTMGGAAGAVAAGAMYGAVALAGSSPSSATLGLASPTPSSATLSLTGPSPSSATLGQPEPRDSASLTPGSALSLTPNSSCEELRIDTGSNRKSILRCDENDNTYLHAPTQDDSSTSPSPNKLHKTPWGKMRDIIQTHRESVKKKSNRGSKSSPDVLPLRRRSLSDGGDSDAPPALTLTIPSSEELESEPHPILRKQRSLELGARPPQHRPPRASKWTKVKRAFLTSASASVPSSPNRHSAFFTDADTEGLSSGCEASGVREEIARDYAALQTRLGREFSDRRGKLNAAEQTRTYPWVGPVATEEQLSADFRKKLEEWKLKKGIRQPPPVPARQDLSEDFLKRWDEWKRMKETNSVPAWEEEAKRDEVLVQTSTGLFKFQGISRSFTRKLHEWEKSRGIAPEASTSALLQAARARGKAPQPQLTRTQSDGSVAPSAAGSGRLHASSLSVNDVDDLDSEYDREHSLEDTEDNLHTRGAYLVEVEAEEICTAAPLVAVSPRHTPQKPVYTYGQAEARLLCETSSAVTGTAVLQPNGTETRLREESKPKETGARPKTNQQSKAAERTRRRISRQKSIEEDAKFIRKTIEEIERSSSSRLREEEAAATELERPANVQNFCERESPPNNIVAIQKSSKINIVKELLKERNSLDDLRDDKRKDADKNNGKKKTKSRARLEREQSKPSETDTEPEVDTVTVEIPRRKKRPRRASEKPRTPPTSLHSDSEGEVYVLKIKAPEMRDGSPEVIVKTTRKIFSPIVRSGESVPRAVIPVDVEDLADVRPNHHHHHHSHEAKNKEEKIEKVKHSRVKDSSDVHDVDEQKTRSRPPLPSSPSSQRKPQPKETAPSIRIMIQRYNKKINEEGHTSGENSGASSPAWRSPTAERRRPPDMPVGVNIRNNPFLEREVTKSASACQLSRRDQTSAEKRLTPTPSTSLDGVLKSHSANALHPEQKLEKSPLPERKIEDSQETIVGETTASTDTIVPTTSSVQEYQPSTAQSLPVLRQMSDTIVPSISRLISENSNYYVRSVSNVEPPVFAAESESSAARLSERTARIRAARERFLASTVPMRREGTSSASDLRPGDRSSKISCESDISEAAGSSQEPSLGRSASTGMVNVEREAWDRVAEGTRRSPRRSRFSLARLAAKIRRKDESAVSKLCRQSLLVQLINKH